MQREVSNGRSRACRDPEALYPYSMDESDRASLLPYR